MTTTLPLLALLACGPAPTAPQPTEGTDHGAAEVELAELMSRLQLHTEKLWWAGANENAPLVGFYLHELHETAEEIIAAEVVEDGHDVSALARSLLLPRLEALAQAEPGRDAFGVQYDKLVAACNGCHRQTDHGFVVIVRPVRPMFTNQRFAPLPAQDPSSP